MNQDLLTIVKNAIHHFRGNSPYVELKKIIEVAQRDCGYDGTTAQLLKFLLQNQNFALIQRQVGPENKRTWYIRDSN